MTDAPEGMLTGPQCADLIRVAQSTWRAYVARHQAPQPRGRVLGRPLWDAAEVEQWARTRPRKGQ